MKNIFNNQRIGWILFIMLIAGYSAYWVDNNRDFNTVIFDENNKVRNIEYIAKEYHKLFKDTDLEHMPEFEPLSAEEQSLVPESLTVLHTESTNNDLNLLAVTVVQDDNIAVLSSGINFSIDSTNSIEDIITNLNSSFEVLKKSYPKDRELLDKIYTEIPIHFTKYTNQENYQEKEYKKEYVSVSEEKDININIIHIYMDRDEYIIAVIKTLYKEEK